MARQGSRGSDDSGGNSSVGQQHGQTEMNVDEVGFDLNPNLLDASHSSPRVLPGQMDNLSGGAANFFGFWSFSL
jgi:hypothetical protein